MCGLGSSGQPMGLDYISMIEKWLKYTKCNQLMKSINRRATTYIEVKRKRMDVQMVNIVQVSAGEKSFYIQKANIDSWGKNIPNQIHIALLHWWQFNPYIMIPGSSSKLLTYNLVSELVHQEETPWANDQRLWTWYYFCSCKLTIGTLFYETDFCNFSLRE